MADNDQSQERTEDATAHREEQSREEGQIVRSREINTAAIMLVGSIGLLWNGGAIAQSLHRILLHCFHFSASDAFDDTRMLAFFHTSISEALQGALPFLVSLLIAGLTGPLLLGGWNVSIKSIMPKMERLDPLSGLKRLFSSQSLIELAKGIIKVLLFAFIAFTVLKKQYPIMLALDHQDLHTAIFQTLSLLTHGTLSLCLGFLLIVAIDVPYQVWSHNQKLRMTKQEVRDEMRDQDGKPEVKSKVRQLQRDMARSRMMSAIPTADVIITNPTHFAVALKYDMERMDAPLVVAKGADMIALRIREIAHEHRIEIVESPALARALYYSTDIERTVPPGLYIAVAQVLAYIYQLKQYRKGSNQRPIRVKDVPVPEEWRRDADGKPESPTKI